MRSNGTLVVMPLCIQEQWYGELLRLDGGRQVRTGAPLRVVKLHEDSERLMKLDKASLAAHFDVVLVTFELLALVRGGGAASNKKKQASGGDAPLRPWATSTRIFGRGWRAFTGTASCWTRHTSSARRRAPRSRCAKR